MQDAASIQKVSPVTIRLVVERDACIPWPRSWDRKPGVYPPGGQVLVALKPDAFFRPARAPSEPSSPPGLAQVPRCRSPILKAQRLACNLSMGLLRSRQFALVPAHQACSQP